jgi:hypothetical protein
MPRTRSAVALAAVVVSAIAVAGAGASATLVSVEPGDAITIAGTDLHCGIPVSGAPTIVCEIGSSTEPVAHSYATATTDRGALIFAATGRPMVLATRSGAKVSGPLQRAPHHRPAHYTVGAALRIAVVGSHIQCAVVGSANGHPSLECGLLSASGQSYWVPGTYATAISDDGAAILLAGRNGASSTSSSKRQPSSSSASERRP